MTEKHKEYNELNQKRHPTGTVLWCMRGTPHHGKVYWNPRPQSIEQYPENGGFSFDSMPRTHGSTWGNIGKNYFISRKECLTEWGDRPLITEDDRPIEEQEHPEPTLYGKRLIYRDASILNISVSEGVALVPYAIHNLEWRVDEEAQRVMGDGGYLTLDEMRDQIWKDKGCRTLIEVREENPLHGVIHQVGNCDDTWREHGTTKGYA